MGIMVSAATKVLCFGAESESFVASRERMQRAGTDVVATVHPTGGIADAADLPVYDTAIQAVRETGANAALVDAPPDAAADSLMEAIDAGLSLVVCRTPNPPVRDIVKAINYLQGSADLGGPRHSEGRIRLLGPGSAGAITPGEGMVGALDVDVFTPGQVAIIAKSGSLAEATAAALTAQGIGQSTCAVTGSALIVPTRLADALGMLEADPDTEVIVLIGGVGDRAEIEAAGFIKEAVTKPLVAYLPGRSAPPGVNIGAPGDFACATPNEMETKALALREAGVLVVSGLEEITPAVAERL